MPEARIVDFLKIVEGAHGKNSPGNWGKFMLLRFTDEWRHRSEIDDTPLIRNRGWSPDHLMVFDLQTGEGALFRPGGLASVDLDKHRIWVCPLFQPFLEWLYKQDTRDLSKLPGLVELPEAEFAFSGYRRPGPDAALRLAADTLNLDEYRVNERTAVAAALLQVGADWLLRGLEPEDDFDGAPGDALPPMSDKDRETVRAALEAIGDVYARLTPPYRRGVVL